MRLQQYLNDEYLGRYTLYGKSIEVFVNPSKKELKDIITIDGKRKNDIRFIADRKKKKLYAWNSIGGIHYDIWYRIGDNRRYDDVTLFSGLAEVKGGKMIMYESHVLPTTLMDGYFYSTDPIGDFIEDFKWVNKYNLKFEKSAREQFDFQSDRFPNYGKEKAVNEEYFMRIKGVGGSAEVFVNPSKRDYRDLPELIRVIADNKEKKVYIWNAAKALHKQTWRQIKKEKEGTDGRLELDPTLLSATGRKMGNVLKIYPEYSEQDPKKFDWLRKYNIVIVGTRE